MSHTVEIHLAINEGGDAAVSLETAQEAHETLVDEFGGEAVRVLTIAVSADLPEVPAVEVDVRDVHDVVAVEAEAGKTEEVKREEFEAA